MPESLNQWTPLEKNKKGSPAACLLNIPNFNILLSSLWKKFIKSNFLLFGLVRKIQKTKSRQNKKENKQNAGTKEDINLSSFQVSHQNSRHFSQTCTTSLCKGVSCFASPKSTTQSISPVAQFEHLRRLRRTDSWQREWGWVGSWECT